MTVRSKRVLGKEAERLQRAARLVRLDACRVEVEADTHGGREVVAERETRGRLRRRLARASRERIGVLEARAHRGDAEAPVQAPGRREAPEVAGRDADAAHLEAAAEGRAERRDVGTL